MISGAYRITRRGGNIGGFQSTAWSDKKKYIYIIHLYACIKIGLNNNKTAVMVVAMPGGLGTPRAHKN